MSRTMTLAVLLAFGLTAGPGGAAFAAKTCRDAQGKFIKCPAAATAPTKCRDKTTKKFAKCGAPNSEAVPAGKA